MREILYRAKRKDNGEWIFGSYALIEERACIILPYIEDNEYHQCEMPVIIEVIPETVGQYTGLNDKNGAKVFEGDVLKDFVTQNIRCVIYNMPSFVLKDSHGYFYWTYYADEYEVIGNLHDNPELLKGVE